MTPSMQLVAQITPYLWRNRRRHCWCSCSRSRRNSLHLGGAGKDSLTGVAARILDGGTEDDSADTITSGGGQDTIYGRAGDDLIKLNAAGKAFVAGGGGNDVIELSLAN